MNRFAFPALAALCVAVFACSSSRLSAVDDAGKADAKRQTKAERTVALQNAVTGAKTSLAKAIEVAEKETGGTAFACEYELEHDGKLELEVELLKDGKVIEVEIDVATGAVLEVEGDDDDADDDEDEDDD